MRTLSCNLQNFGLTYVYVVDPGAEQWPDKIVGLRYIEMGYAAFARAVIDLNISHVQMCGGVANRLRPWLCHHGAFRCHT